jgi:hypothetical protein
MAYAENKQQEILAKLYITQEHSLTIHTTLNNNINNGGDGVIAINTDNNSNSNVMHKKEYTKAGTRNNNNNRKRKPITTTSTKELTLTETKSSKECLACTLGASISKRGYSPMKFNPYKHHHSFKLKNTRSTSH